MTSAHWRLPSANLCPLVMCNRRVFLGHIVKAFQNNFAFIISTETCFWLKRVSDRTLAVFPLLETRFNTHNQNAFRNAFLELLRLSSISQCREYGSPGMFCHCGAALRNFIRNTIHSRHTISGKLSLPKFKTDCYKYSPIVSSISAWNRLDSEIREASSIYSFKKLFKQSI